VTDLVRFLHVLAMATWLASHREAWLAASLWLASDAAAALSAGPDAARSFVARARRALTLDRVAGLATILTGLALLHYSGIWPNLRHGLWMGIALAVVRAGLADGLVSPALKRLAAGLAAGQEAASLRPQAARMALGSRLGHAAWLGALAGMLLFRSAP
jgi:hypothetical protein